VLGGSRSGRPRSERLRLATAFTAGNVLGGTVAAAVATVIAGVLSLLPIGILLAVTTTVLLLFFVLDFAGRTALLPQRKRQIPQAVFHNGIVRGAFRFGFEYGTSARTHITSVAPFVPLWLLLSLNLEVHMALVVGAGFGAGRALPVVAHLGLGSSQWDTNTDRQARMVAILGSVSSAVLAGYVAVLWL
jgi:hypothetical protein